MTNRNLDEQTVFKGEDNMHNQESNGGKTQSGLERNIAGALTYLAGAITGIIFILIEKEDKFVRFHALQSIFISVAILIISIVLGFIPLIGWILSLLLAPLSFILWIVLMWKAYQEKWFKLPLIGEMAENQLNK